MTNKLWLYKLYLGRTLHRKKIPNKTYWANFTLSGNSQVRSTDHISFLITQRIDIPWIYDRTRDHRPCLGQEVKYSSDSTGTPMQLCSFAPFRDYLLSVLSLQYTRTIHILRNLSLRLHILSGWFALSCLPTAVNIEATERSNDNYIC